MKDYKDRDKDIEYLKLALCSTGLGVDYYTALKIDKVIDKLSEKKGDFSLRDAATIELEVEREQKEDENEN